MENLKLTTKSLSKLSKLINKMGISSLIMKINVNTGDEEFDKEAVAKELIILVIDNLYKVEEEMTEFIAEIKGISKKEAENVDVIPLIKELINNDKFKNFLKFA